MKQAIAIAFVLTAGCALACDVNEPTRTLIEETAQFIADTDARSIDTVLEEIKLAIADAHDEETVKQILTQMIESRKCNHCQKEEKK